jgi:hypothetical protein
MTAADIRHSFLGRNSGPRGQSGASTISIFSKGAALSAFPRPREREAVQLKSTRQLREFLFAATDETLVFHGLWEELTVPVQYMLAAWTLGGPGRASAIRPIDLVTRRCNQAILGWITRPDIVLVQPTGSYLIRRGTVRPCTELEALDLAKDEHSAVALAITGHGAEHCVQFGSLWLSTDPHARLPGPIVDPQDLRSPLVFLNSCSSMRMGDSAVPISHSLAAALYARGTTVIGSFRNLHTSLDAPRLLVEGLASGQALGSALRNVNAAAVRDGAVIPPFQIMGDPTLRTNSLTARLPRRNRADKHVGQAVADDMISTEVFVHTIRSWFQPSDEFETSYRQFKETARRVLALSHEQVSQSLSEEEIGDVLQMGRDAAAALRASLLEDLRRKIQAIRWLEICYAPVSRTRVSRSIGNSSKTPLKLRHVYRARGRGMLAVTREDCCVRGTLREWLGARAPGRLHVRLSPRAILIEACPLAQDELGTFFIHRTGAMPAVPWPQGGGRISFDVHELPFKGRVTVVAARLGPKFVHFEYRTLFIPTASNDDGGLTPAAENIRSG